MSPLLSHRPEQSQLSVPHAAYDLNCIQFAALPSTERLQAQQNILGEVNGLLKECFGQYVEDMELSLKTLRDCESTAILVEQAAAHFEKAAVLMRRDLKSVLSYLPYLPEETRRSLATEVDKLMVYRKECGAVLSDAAPKLLHNCIEDDRCDFLNEYLPGEVQKVLAPVDSATVQRLTLGVGERLHGDKIGIELREEADRLTPAKQRRFWQLFDMVKDFFNGKNEELQSAIEHVRSRLHFSVRGHGAMQRQVFDTLHDRSISSGSVLALPSEELRESTVAGASLRLFRVGEEYYVSLSAARSMWGFRREGDAQVVCRLGRFADGQAEANGQFQSLCSSLRGKEFVNAQGVMKDGSVLALLRRHSQVVEMSNVAIRRASLLGFEFSGMRFSNVQFDSTDLTATRFEQCWFDSACRVSRCRREGVEYAGSHYDSAVASVDDLFAESVETTTSQGRMTRLFGFARTQWHKLCNSRLGEYIPVLGRQGTAEAEASVIEQMRGSSWLNGVFSTKISRDGAKGRVIFDGGMLEYAVAPEEPGIAAVKVYQRVGNSYEEIDDAAWSGDSIAALRYALDICRLNPFDEEDTFALKRKDTEVLPAIARAGRRAAASIPLRAVGAAAPA